MTLYQKLVLFMVAATVAPLALVGILFSGHAERALRDRIRAAQVQAVEQEAEQIAELLRDRAGDLGRAASYFDLSQASDAELSGAVRLLYRTAPEVAAAVLLDARGGVVGVPALLGAESSDPSLSAHPPASEETIARLIAFAPLDRALAEGPGAVVLSPVYGAPEREETAIAVALPVSVGSDVRVFATELSLGPIQHRAARAGGFGRLMVIDEEGRIVAHPDPARLREPLEGPEVQRALAASEPAAVREAGGPVPLLTAFAPVPVEGLGWRVLTALPESEAFAPVRRVRLAIVGSSAAALVLLALLGAAFTARVRKGLGSVRAGAEAFSRGDLTHRIDPPAELELRELADTFNRMGDELSEAHVRLERWNEDLQAQVEARTRELREAQARLVETQKLAAVSQLGAGVAHEINNPLATILGNVQLMLLQKQRSGLDASNPEVAALRTVEGSVKRCQDVTRSLLRFGQQSPDPRGHRLPLDAVVRSVMPLVASQLEAAGITTNLDLEEPPPEIVGDVGHLSQVLLHLVTNARTALEGREAPVLEIAARAQGGEALLQVRDNGRGMTPEVRARIFEPFFTTKDVWSNLGLGLSVSFRLVEEHGGHIDIESAPGAGTTVRVRLPLAPVV